jgi:hypothetical protein
MNAATKGRDNLKESTIKTTSPTRKLTRLQYAVTVLGALAIAALAPATAHADTNEPTGPSGGCTYTDADGYDIPIDEGQGVFVDGKIVSCHGGTIVITTAPLRGDAGSVRQQLGNSNLPVATGTSKHPPLANQNVSASKAP